VTGLLPRILATVLLLVSLAMIVPLVQATAGFAKGTNVELEQIVIPLIFLSTAYVLTYLLAKKVLAVQLFVMAFALWVVAAGYYFYTLTA
jgi:hypothetical protein